jgi:hypothetical protein
MMNPTFQRLNTFISSLPITGHAVLADNDRTTAALEQHAQRVAAEIAGQGNIPPGGATTESIGGTAMAGAQQASGGGPEALGTPGRPMPDIPGQIAQHWEPVHTLMQGGKADIRPMLTAIDQLYGRDPTFAPNEDAIRSMVAQLTSQAPGGAGRGPALANTPGGERFVGPVQPRDPNAPPGPVMVPWSALKDFRSTVGQQIGPDGVRVPEQHVPTLRDWATDAMRAAAEGEAPGRGASLLDTATRATAQLEPWQTKMEQMGGKPYGPAPRAFKPTPGGEQSAANAITSKLGAPSVTEPFTDPSRFPASYWRSIAGQILSRLGYKPEGDWTPEKFTRDYRKYGDQGMEQLTQSPAGHPTQHLQDIRDVAQVAGNATTTPSRHGLTASMGAGYAIHALLQHMGLLGAAVGGPVGASVAPLAAAYGMSRGMVSPAFKRALAGMSGSPNYSSELQGVGRSAASIADEDMYRRLRMSPAAPAAGYQ